MYDWSHTWYKPGNWSLPQWWTDGPPMRVGHKATYEELQYFYDSSFVRNVLGHKGGMTQLPRVSCRGFCVHC